MKLAAKKQGHPLIWINTGEISGDLHAAALAKSLKNLAPELRFTGMGGPALAETDFLQEFNVDELSVMGLTEVISCLPRILNLLGRIKKRLMEVRPDAIILVDAPDFNFRIARIANELNIPVFYYISPKVWAWRKGRIKFLKRYVKRILCILPFEEDFYAAHGVDASYVGNPLMDQIPFENLEMIRPEENRITILPGSRQREISGLMPPLLGAAEILLRKRPELNFCLSRAPGINKKILTSMLPRDFPVEIIEPEERYQAMRKSRVILAASGTATLEAALIGTPCVIVYRLSKLSFMAGKILVDLPYVGLPNLILHQEVFPELLQREASPELIAQKAEMWLDGGKALNNTMALLEKIKSAIGGPGASLKAAEIILRDLVSLTGLPYQPSA